MKHGKWVSNIVKPGKDHTHLSCLNAEERQWYLEWVSRHVQGTPQPPPGSPYTQEALTAMGLVGLYKKT